MAKPHFPAPNHDHKLCVARSLERAESAYREVGARLTNLRESVLRELASSHVALGAYDIIQRLQAGGRRVAPISVYRVLESLLEVGLVHRIESRNAFVACHSAHSSAQPILFMVCETCGTVAEAGGDGLEGAIVSAAQAAKFKPNTSTLELAGLCEHCRTAGAQIGA